MATEAGGQDGGADALGFGAVVLGTAIDTTGIRRDAKSKLRRAAEQAGGEAGGAMTKAMGDAAAKGAAPAAERVARQFRRRGRFARAGEEAGKEFGAGVGDGADKAVNRGPLSGDKVADRYTRAMLRVLRNRQAEIHAAQTASMMTPKEAEAAGLAAAREYDRAILRGMARLRDPRVSANGRGRSASGADARTRMAETLINPRPNPARGERSAEAVAQRYVARLRRSLDAEGAGIQADLLENLISPREAERRGREAGERYMRALLRSQRRMQAEGRMSNGAAAAFGDAAINAREFGSELTRLNDAPGLLGRIGTSAKMWIAGVFVAALMAAAQGLRFLIGTLEDAKQRMVAGMRMSAASALFGVPLKELKKLAAEAAAQFELTAGQAANVATQVGKMAARAGQSARAQQLLNAAMDLGAANGLTLAEITEALDQTFRAQDEGLNRMGLADPSQHYKKLAREIGTTEDKLSDAQKQMAMMNAIIEAGTKVQGQYGRQMEGDLGTLNQFENQIKASREEIGIRFLPIAAQMAQRLSGPMAGAVRFITRLLDALSTSLDRVIRKMEEMGVAAARIAPYQAERNIREGREEMGRMVPDMARLARRAGIDPGTERDWWTGRVSGGHFDMAEINAARERARQIERYWESIARSGRVPGGRAPDLNQARGMAPVVPGRERETAELINRASQGDRAAAQRLLSDAQDYKMAADQLGMAVTRFTDTQERIADLETSMPDLIARAGLQEQLDDVNRATDAMLRTARQAATAAGVTGEAWALLTEGQRIAHLPAAEQTRFAEMRKRADALDLQINGPPPEQPVTTAPAQISKEAEGARKALRDLVTELATVGQFRNAVGEPFRNLEEVPAALRSAVSEIIGLEREIEEVQEKIRDSGQAAAPAVQRHLAALTSLVTQRKGAAQQLRDELAANGDLISDQARQLRDGLTEAASGFRMLQSLGVGRDAPQEMSSLVDQVVRLDEQVKKTERDMATLRRELETLPAGLSADRVREALAAAQEWTEEQKRQRAEALAILATFKELRDVLRDLPNVGATVFQGMDESEMRDVTALLRTQAANVRLVREAEERLLIAREQHGPMSRRAKEAERELAEVRRDARRAIFALIMAIRASTLSEEEQARVIAILRGAMDGLNAEAEDGAKNFRKMADAAQLVAEAVSALAGIGVELELITEKQADVITGFAEMASSAAEFAVAAKTANPAGMIKAGIGFIQGAVKFGRGLSGESEAQKAVRLAMADLEDALESLEKTILNDRSTREIEEDRNSITAAADALEGDRDRMSSYGPTRRGSLADLAVEMGLAGAGESKGAKIEALRRWAADLDEKYGTNLAWYVENSRPQELLLALSGLESQLGRELTELGTFGSDVAGVLAAVNYELDVLRESDAAVRIQRTTQALLASTNSLGEFADELAELAGLDLSTVAGRERRDAIVKAMMDRSRATDVNFGNLTPDQFRELLMAWATAVPGEGEGETNSAAVNRSVTEVTGNRLVGWLATIAHYARRIAEYLTGETAAGPPTPAGVEPTDAGGSVPALSSAPSAGPTPITVPAPLGIGAGENPLLGPMSALAVERHAAASASVLSALGAALPRGERTQTAGPPVFYASITVPLTLDGRIRGDDPEQVAEQVGRGLRKGLGDMANEALGARQLEQMRARGNAHQFRRS
jgi:polyhydroxyalkanoate synthesis regulator phasin